ncbi:MAG: HAMP domain-containing protein [Candidatus Riflebacteria bacterium]|nr:HAMP domain-containing protein [Candidatus Riflebacteria bacterium]
MIFRGAFRRFGLSQRIVFVSMVLCIFVVGIMGVTLRRLREIVEATAHLRLADDVLVVGSQVQDDLLALFQAQEIFDQYLSEQTWRHYFEFSTRIGTLLDRARELRSFRHQNQELDILEKTRLEMADLLQNATYTIDPNFPMGAVSTNTLQRIRGARTRLHQQISAVLVKERESRRILESMLKTQIESMSGSAIWVAGLVLAGGMGFAFYLHRAAMAPLKNLMESIRTADENTLPVPVIPAGAPEMRDLIESFNSMNASLGRNQKRLHSMLQLAVTVAHEVRNPIAAIGTAIQALEKGFPQDSPDREIFPEIQREVHRVNTIISDLLVFARPRPLNAEQVLISELTDELRILMTPFLTSKDISFESAIEPAINQWVGDRDQLHRALLNLLTNAVDAIGQNGRILFIAEALDADRIRLIVEDSGVGIAEADRERIFDPFYTTKTKGTGLGLSIVSDIVERHGGQVRAATGKTLSGARFELDLPREAKCDQCSDH